MNWIGVVVRASDSRTMGREFNPRLHHCFISITGLGKLLSTNVHPVDPRVNGYLAKDSFYWVAPEIIVVAAMAGCQGHDMPGSTGNVLNLPQNHGLCESVLSVISDIELKSKAAIIQSLMDLNEEIVSKARDNLFVSMVAKCTEQCEVLNITGSGQPVLKLKDRRGENACMSRAEDVYDMYTYVAGIVNEIPKAPLSSQSRFPQGFSRKDSISDCNCKKCSAQIADLRVQISELKFMIREMNITREKVESYDNLCTMFMNLETSVNGLENNTSVQILDFGSTRGGPTIPPASVNLDYKKPLNERTKELGSEQRRPGETIHKNNPVTQAKVNSEVIQK